VKRAKGFYPLLLIIVFTSLISFAFASISFDGGGIIYRGANKGDIFFSVDYGASKMYFDNGFLMINNLNGLFSSIGFSCDTATANMTITKIKADELDYTVNAPTDVTSITKIYAGSKGLPSDLSGSTSWSYNSNLKIVTVNVLHQSPSNIIIEWKTDVVQDWIIKAYHPAVDMMGVVLLIMATIVIFSVLQGLPVDMELIVQAVLATIILSLGIYILTYFRF